jgi:hypothetical protein
MCDQDRASQPPFLDPISTISGPRRRQRSGTVPTVWPRPTKRHGCSSWAHPGPRGRTGLSGFAPSLRILDRRNAAGRSLGLSVSIPCAGVRLRHFGFCVDLAGAAPVRTELDGFVDALGFLASYASPIDFNTKSAIRFISSRVAPFTACTARPAITVAMKRGSVQLLTREHIIKDPYCLPRMGGGAGSQVLINSRILERSRECRACDRVSKRGGCGTVGVALLRPSKSVPLSL